jgi:O-antigen ligase
MELLKDWSREGGVVASVVFRNQDADQVAGFSGRGELWAGVTPLIMDRPLLGRGYQGSRAALLETMPWAGYAHNSLMQSLLDLGIVGSLMLFFGFGSAFLVGSLRGSVIDATVYRTRLTILGVCTFELLNGVSDEVFAGAPGYQTLLVLACVCLAARVRQARFEVVTAQQPVWYAWPTGHQAPNWSGQMPLRAADGLSDANRSPRPVDAHGA